MKEYRKVLSVAGSDSGGGAGIQADIKAISACGGYASTAITAITVQNTIGVKEVFAVPPEIVKQQIKAVLEDIGTDCVKIGMLHNTETIKVVYESIKESDVENIVLDPVMVSTSGNTLLQNEAIFTLKRLLIPEVTVITPNIPEAEILLGRKVNSKDDLPEYSRELAEIFNVSVLLKGGHLPDNDLTDIFYNISTKEITHLKSERVETRNTHGTGCTLSSALATFLARGYGLNEAAKKAKEYINNAIIKGAGYKTGEGHGPVNHFYAFWK